MHSFVKLGELFYCNKALDKQNIIKLVVGAQNMSAVYPIVSIKWRPRYAEPV